MNIDYDKLKQETVHTALFEISSLLIKADILLTNIVDNDTNLEIEKNGLSKLIDNAGCKLSDVRNDIVTAMRDIMLSRIFDFMDDKINEDKDNKLE